MQSIHSLAQLQDSRHADGHLGQPGGGLGTFTHLDGPYDGYPEAAPRMVQKTHLNPPYVLLKYIGKEVV